MNKIFNFIKKIGHFKFMLILMVIFVAINILFTYHRPISLADTNVYNNVLVELEEYHNSDIDNLKENNSYYTHILDSLYNVSNKYDENFIIECTKSFRYFVCKDSTEWITIYKIKNKFLKEDLDDIILTIKVN